MVYKYRTIVVGGTFDHLHTGHKTLLHFAFSLAETVYVTITSDSYTKIHKPYVAPFTQREKNVQTFLKKEHFLSRAKIFPINDVYGITTKQTMQIEAIVVTKDSLPGAEKVNEKREAQGLPPLKIEIMQLVSGETGLFISSSYIRAKEFMRHTSLLPQQLRKTLQQPFGKILTCPTKDSFKDFQKIIAVGDVTVQILHHLGLLPVLCVIDFVVERKKQQTSLKDLGFLGGEVHFHVINPPGSITPALWSAVENALLVKGNNALIVVDGEEDLAVLPLVLLAPVGYTICYGQPHKGMVIVPVTLSAKQKALTLITEFIHNTTRGH